MGNLVKASYSLLILFLIFLPLFFVADSTYNFVETSIDSNGIHYETQSE